LTRHDQLDASFNNAFLLTYRSFTSSAELCELLVQRFNIEPPNGLTLAELQVWTQQKQKVIRIRVMNILKRWLEQFWAEPNDETTKTLVDKIRTFAEVAIPTVQTPALQGLIELIEQRRRNEEGRPNSQRISIQSADIPQPLLPKKMKKLKLVEINPIEVARQLTLIEYQLYSKIRLDECLNKAWQRKKNVDAGERELAPNIRALIQHSNQLANWVGGMILAKDDLKKRVRVIKHFVEVADVPISLAPLGTLTLSLTLSVDMPFLPELLNCNLHYFRSRHSASISTRSDMVPSQRAHLCNPGADASTSGKHQKLL
jgi:son of sevenless-like protein